MISVTRLNGQRFAVNPDLIEQVREIPETAVVLIDGTLLHVSESFPDLIDLIDASRARVLGAALRFRDSVAAENLANIAESGAHTPKEEI